LTDIIKKTIFKNYILIETIRNFENMNKINAIKGTYDILPDEVMYWQRIEKIIRDITALFGYSEIRTPIFEETGLFARSIGEDTDIVGKEMYSFYDMGKRSLTLRPEGTASVIRAFIEHSLDQKNLPQKLWYMGPMFRQEQPQKGRQRQFHQFGVEIIGSSLPVADSEAIVLFDRIAKEIGLKNRVFSINSIGSEESRKLYKTALSEFLDKYENGLCADCKRRRLTNPLRVLDCKKESCRKIISENSVPKTLDYLAINDRQHFETVIEYLERLNIRYKIDNFLVRGLDYYTGTVFEMESGAIGAQSAVMGGGRYDKLVGELGGSNVPSVGFACGMERLILASNAENEQQIIPDNLKYYVVIPEPSLFKKGLEYLGYLRNKGLSADMDMMGRSMKSQMKSASRLGVEFVLIVEQDEEVSIREMSVSQQKRIGFEEFKKYIENTTNKQK